MRRLLVISIVAVAFLFTPLFSAAGDKDEVFLIHLKTSLRRDDSQICVAYNIMWAALEDGRQVKVLIDADAVNTYKVGWFGKDDIEGYKLPENLIQELSKQFRVPADSVPKTYGSFLTMLHGRGVEFYINREMLIVSKIGTPEDPLKKISSKFFKPVTIADIVKMRKEARYYMAY